MKQLFGYNVESLYFCSHTCTQHRGLKKKTDRNMRITLLQTDIVWGSPAANATAAKRLMEQAPESDLYVLPEMWSTGFATQPEGIAEGDGGSLSWMRRMAREYQAALSGSIATALRHDGATTYHNRHYMVCADGTEAYYDKHHLFGYGGEDKHYTPGTRRTVVEAGGWRWLLLVCYDLRFPVWSRYRGDYDGILIVANWPGSRQEAWSTLLRARAIENQCCVVAVNRVGSDAACTYRGGSVIIDAKGQTLAACPLGEVSWATADIDLESQRRFRNHFPVLADRDPYPILMEENEENNV